MIVVAFENPRQAMAPTFTTIMATAFAATMSSPMCPRIAAKVELARLHTTSFITDGAAIFKKSLKRTAFLLKRYLIRNPISLLTNE